MEELFKKLSLDENCSYDITYEKSYSPFVISPLTRREDGFQIKDLTLEVPYKNHTVQVIYKLSKNHTYLL